MYQMFCGVGKMKIKIILTNEVPQEMHGYCISTGADIVLKKDMVKNDSSLTFYTLIHEIAEAVVQGNPWVWKSVGHEDLETLTDTVAHVLWDLGARIDMKDGVEIEI